MKDNKYSLSEVSHMVDVPKLGRNKLYRILRDQGIVDEFNKPGQIYIDNGVLALGSPKSYFHRYVTVVAGNKGLLFIRHTVVDYLEYHPMPSFPRKKVLVLDV